MLGALLFSESSAMAGPGDPGSWPSGGLPGLIHNSEFPGCLTTGETRSFPGSYGTRGLAEEALRVILVLLF